MTIDLKNLYYKNPLETRLVQEVESSSTLSTVEKTDAGWKLTYVDHSVKELTSINIKPLRFRKIHLLVHRILFCVGKYPIPLIKGYRHRFDAALEEINAKKITSPLSDPLNVEVESTQESSESAETESSAKPEILDEKTKRLDSLNRQKGQLEKEIHSLHHIVNGLGLLVNDKKDDLEIQEIFSSINQESIKYGDKKDELEKLLEAIETLEKEIEELSSESETLEEEVSEEEVEEGTSTTETSSSEEDEDALISEAPHLISNPVETLDFLLKIFYDPKTKKLTETGEKFAGYTDLYLRSKPGQMRTLFENIAESWESVSRSIPTPIVLDSLYKSNVKLFMNRPELMLICKTIPLLLCFMKTFDEKSFLKVKPERLNELIWGQIEAKDEFEQHFARLSPFFTEDAVEVFKGMLDHPEEHLEIYQKEFQIFGILEKYLPSLKAASKFPGANTMVRSVISKLIQGRIAKEMQKKDTLKRIYSTMQGNDDERETFYAAMGLFLEKLIARASENHSVLEVVPILDKFVILRSFLKNSLEEMENRKGESAEVLEGRKEELAGKFEGFMKELSLVCLKGAKVWFSEAQKNPLEKQLLESLLEQAKDFTLDPGSPDILGQIWEGLLIPFIQSSEGSSSSTS